MSFNYAKISTADIGTIRCSNFIPPISPSTIINKCMYRIGVDPSSNPDSNTGGLLVKYNETQPSPTLFNMPITAVPNGSLSIADNFSDDIEGKLTINPTSITCNSTGKYLVTVSISALFFNFNPGNLLVCQILKTGNEVFSSPPAVNASSSIIDTSQTPIGGLYPGSSFCSGSSIVSLLEGQEISLVLWLLYDQMSISLTSGFTIEKLD